MFDAGVQSVFAAPKRTPQRKGRVLADIRQRTHTSARQHRKGKAQSQRRKGSVSEHAQGSVFCPTGPGFQQLGLVEEQPLGLFGDLPPTKPCVIRLHCHLFGCAATARTKEMMQPCLLYLPPTNRGA